MDKDDARKLSPAEQHERRRQVIRAHKRGRTKTQIAEGIGLSYTAVSKVIARYEAEGIGALAPRTRGRRSGEDRALTVEQEEKVQRIICDKRPEQLKMEFALWSRAAVMQLIVVELGVTLHVRSVGKYLARWMIIDGVFNHERLIEFFESLVRDAGRKVFLILDNLSVHHCKPVKTWLAEHKAQMEVFYLPSYSPELNPEERLNADLKHAIRSKVPVRTKAKLQAATEEHMNTISSKPERVRAYFQDPYVKYAA